MSRPIITAIDEETGIARITLNRPEVLNALDVAMARAFRAAVEDICARQGVRAIILAAAGRAFVAGGDVAAFGGDLSKSADVVNALLDALHPAILALRAQDAPVIAAVRGVAAGAGLSLVLGPISSLRKRIRASSSPTIGSGSHPIAAARGSFRAR